MSVTKTTGAEVYSVRNQGEWATIVVRSWEEPGHDGKSRHRGELLINSTFGSWSNYWSAPGESFKKFLVGLDFDYLMTKLMGREMEEYDGYATIKDLRSRMLAMRREGRLTKKRAAWLWNEIDDRHETLEHSQEGFVSACGEILSDAGEWWNQHHTRHDTNDLNELLQEPWTHTKTRNNPAAVGFHRVIWPEFVQALQEELEAESACFERPRG
jgi:hypothetical protein